MTLHRVLLLTIIGIPFFLTGLRAQDDMETAESLAQLQAETAEVPVEPPVRITFAPPEASGRFVVGVFDEKGYLVRTLMTDQDKSVFDIGLNGFITTWDGKLADGTFAPSGRYNVRGYVVGGVEVEGVAYHFNDWTADGFADWQVVADVQLVSPDRVFALVARDSVWTMVVSSLAGEVVWSLPLGEEVETAPVVQADARWVVVKIADSLQIYSSEDGKFIGKISGITRDDFSAYGDRLLIGDGKKITEFQLPEASVLREWGVSSSFRKLVALKSGAAVILDSPSNEIVWTAQDTNQRTALEPNVNLETLAASADGLGVWVAGTHGKMVTVRQIDPIEGVVRELKVESGEPVPVRISAMGTRLGLLYAWDRSTRWTCLERGNAADTGTSEAPETVDWTILADRRVVDAGQFGISPEGLVASGAGDDLPDEITVALQPNPLNPDHPDKLVVVARSEDGQVWLTADNGLKLLPVSEPDGWTRVALVGDANADAITLYQGNGWVVEEFQITGIDQIASFDGGSFLLANPAVTSEKSNENRTE